MCTECTSRSRNSVGVIRQSGTVSSEVQVRAVIIDSSPLSLVSSAYEVNRFRHRGHVSQSVSAVRVYQQAT